MEGVQLLQTLLHFGSRERERERERVMLCMRRGREHYQNPSHLQRKCIANSAHPLSSSRHSYASLTRTLTLTCSARLMRGCICSYEASTPLMIVRAFTRRGEPFSRLCTCASIWHTSIWHTSKWRNHMAGRA